LGSLQEEEFDYFTKIINQNPSINFIVAPHDVDSKTIKKLQKLIDDSYDLYSQKKTNIKRILIVDTIGDLKYLYRHCHSVYVGGGFRKGPHNLLEPLVYGVPICAGPNIAKFPMAQELSRRGLVVVIPEIEGLELVLLNFLRLDRDRYRQAAQQFISAQQKELSPLIRELLS